MPGLPPLIEEDMQALDAAVDELLRKSEATAIIIVDKGGPILTQRGAVAQYDTTTIAALAAGSFSATQAIAERLGESNFTCIYQQGEAHSTLFCDIDEDVLLIAIFGADVSVGVVKHYASSTIDKVGAQLKNARQRAPGQGIDLVSLNSPDAADIFHKK